MDQIKTLPKREFVSPPGHPYGHVDETNALLERRFAHDPTGEIPHDPEMTRRINEIAKSVKDFVAELGFDVSERMVTSEKVHFYHEEDFKKHEARATIPGGLAINLPGPGAILLDVDAYPSGHEELVWHALCHEYIHGVQNQRVHARPLKGGSWALSDPDIGVSIRAENRFYLLNEYATETIAEKIVRDKWPDNELLAGLSHQEDFFYSSLMEVGDALVETVAKHQDRSSKDVLHDLQVATITGDAGVMKKFEEAIGPEGMEALAGANDPDHRTLAQVAIRMGLGAEKVAENR